MKILMVMSKKSREHNICKKIESYIKEHNDNTTILMITWGEENFIKKVIRFQPNVIMVFPFTGEGLSEIFIILKYMFNSKIICFATEGVFNTEMTEEINLFIGIDKYDETLVDEQIFWGRKTARIIGEGLLKEKKLKEKNQIYVYGYPLYEEYFTANRNAMQLSELENKINKYSKEKVFIFATGFQFAEYNEETIIGATDLINTDDQNKQKKIMGFMKLAKKVREYREEFIKGLVHTAQNNKDCLFVIKMHPCEIEAKDLIGNPYNIFKEFENIILLDYPIELSKIIKSANLFFHIGSTTMVESYLAEVNSCYLMNEALHSDKTYEHIFYEKFYWPSTYEIYIKDLDAFIQKNKRNVQVHVKNEVIDEVLLDFFNINLEHIRGKKIYNPSEQVALRILEKGQVNKIPVDNYYLKKAMKNLGNKVIYEYSEMIYQYIKESKFERIIEPIEKIKLLSEIDDFNKYQDKINKLYYELKDSEKNNIGKLEQGIRDIISYCKLEPAVYEKIDNCKNSHIVIFGASKKGEEFYLDIKQKCLDNNIKISFMDNDSNKWDKIYLGCTVLKPDKENFLDKHYIYIASQFKEEIYEQLSNIGIDLNKVIKNIYKI